MRVTIVTIIIILVFAITGFTAKSEADEAVFCLSEEYRYIVLIGNGEKCLEDESEVKVSGAAVQVTDGLTPLADFRLNDACADGSSGTVTDVGLDYNADGKLERNEILSTVSSCGRM